jgi:hypothetical protein
MRPMVGDSIREVQGTMLNVGLLSRNCGSYADISPGAIRFITSGLRVMA